MRMSVRLCMVSVYAENWRISEKKGTFTKLILTLLVLLFIPFPYTVSAVFVCMYVFMPHSPGILLFVSCFFFMCFTVRKWKKRERYIWWSHSKICFDQLTNPLNWLEKVQWKATCFNKIFEIFFFRVLVRTTYKNVLWQKKNDPLK